jgi:hypothetical protein
MVFIEIDFSTIDLFGIPDWSSTVGKFGHRDLDKLKLFILYSKRFKPAMCGVEKNGGTTKVLSCGISILRTVPL